MAKSVRGGPPALNAVRKLGNQAAGNREMATSLFQLVAFVLIGFAMYGKHSKDITPASDMTFIDCFYFTMVTVTTIGYGDITCNADNRTCKLVTIFFATVGLLAIGGAIGTIANGFVEKAKAKAKARQKKMLNEAKKVAGAMDNEDEEENEDEGSAVNLAGPDDAAAEESVEPALTTPSKDGGEASADSALKSGAKSGKIIKKKRTQELESSKDTFASATAPVQSETDEPEATAQVGKKKPGGSSGSC